MAVLKTVILTPAGIAHSAYIELVSGTVLPGMQLPGMQLKGGQLVRHDAATMTCHYSAVACVAHSAYSEPVSCMVLKGGSLPMHVLGG